MSGLTFSAVCDMTGPVLLTVGTKHGQLPVVTPPGTSGLPWLPGQIEDGGEDVSRPIKVSDELYERLRGQAEAQGLTLQDALIELITTPHEGLNALQRRLETSRKAATSQQSEQQKLRRELAALRKQIEQLFELRKKDVEAFNSWTDTWKRVAPLSERVTALEQLEHRHFWQVIEEDKE